MKKSVSKDQESRRYRVRWILDHVFGGSQRRMARGIGISQSLISQALSGKQPVSDHLLEAIARVPNVRSDWIHGGSGEPLLAVETGTLPVATIILPGPPAHHSHLLTGGRHSVAQDHDRPTCYYLQLTAENPILQDDRLSLREGDLLLIETDCNSLAREDLLINRLCAMLIKSDQLQRGELVLLRRKNGKLVPDRTHVELIGKEPNQPDTCEGRLLRGITLSGPVTTATDEAPAEDDSKNGDALPENPDPQPQADATLVGVVLLMFRPSMCFAERS